MTLLRARRRADELETLVSSGRLPVDPHPELARLSSTVAALRDHAPVAPRAEFATGLRERLMVEAETVLTPDGKSLALPVRARGPRERKLVAAATAVVLVGGTAGMAVASQSALPGDTLYPIKRAVERAEAGLATSDAGKGQDLLDQASDRLTEAQGLLREDATSPRLPGTIDEFANQAQQGATLLAASFDDSRDPQRIEQVRTFLAASLSTLQELAKTAPPDAQVALANAAAVLGDLDQQMLALCGTCAADLPALRTPDLVTVSSDLIRAIEAAAAKAAAAPTRAGSGKQATPRGTTGTPDKSSAPGDSTTGGPGKVLGDATKGVGDKGGTVGGTVGGVVDEVTDPVEELLDGVVPGAGDLVGGVTDGLGGEGGLLGNG